MAKRPWMPFYVGDWLKSKNVLLMTPEQRGGYIQLLCHAWDSEDGGLPNNPDDLAVLSGLNDRWTVCEKRIIACFELRDDRLFNQRIDAEIAKVHSISDERSRAANKRWECKSNANASRLHMQNDATHTHTHTHTHNTTPLPPKGGGVSVEFEKFWAAYPKRVGKKSALKAWRKLKLDAESEKILNAVARCKASDDWKREVGRYIPHPATWLNRGGWDDELTGTVNAPAKPAGHEHRQPDACVRCTNTGAVKHNGVWKRCDCLVGRTVTDEQLREANAA